MANKKFIDLDILTHYNIKVLEKVDSKITSSLSNYLTTSGTASNSSKLNNQSANYYLDYNNFTNKPIIPTGAAADKGVVTTIDTSANLPTSNAVKTFVEGKGYVTSSGSVASATNATKLNNQDASYYLNYNNFTNKPTIPTVNNATITITHKNTTLKSFTANQSSNISIDVAPTYTQLYSWGTGSYKNTTGSVSLSAPYTDFNSILFVWGSEGFGCYTTSVVPVSLISDISQETHSIAGRFGFNFSGTSTLRQTYGVFTGTQTFNLQKAENCGLKAIYGIR